jgi:hypothetical protein
MKALDGGGQCHAPAALFPLPINTKLGVSQKQSGHKTEKKMVPTTGIGTVSLGGQDMARVLYRICGDVHILRVWPPFTP